MPEPSKQLALALSVLLTRVEKNVLDLLAAWPLCTREQLAGLMGGVTMRRVNQMLRSLSQRSLVRADSNLHVLTDEGLTYLARRDRAAVGLTFNRWSAEPSYSNPCVYAGTTLRARHPRGVIARLRSYTRYYWSNAPGEDQPPFPTTLFVVDTEEVEAIYVHTAGRMSRMLLPILVSCMPVLSSSGILGRSWHHLWEPESPRLALSELSAYSWDSLYHRMGPVGGNR